MLTSEVTLMKSRYGIPGCHPPDMSTFGESNALLLVLLVDTTEIPNNGNLAAAVFTTHLDRRALRALAVPTQCRVQSSKPAGGGDASCWSSSPCAIYRAKWGAPRCPDLNRRRPRAGPASPATLCCGTFHVHYLDLAGTALVEDERETRIRPPAQYQGDKVLIDILAT